MTSGACTEARRVCVCVRRRRQKQGEWCSSPIYNFPHPLAVPCTLFMFQWRNLTFSKERLSDVAFFLWGHCFYYCSSMYTESRVSCFNSQQWKPQGSVILSNSTDHWLIKSLLLGKFTTRAACFYLLSPGHTLGHESFFHYGLFLSSAPHFLHGQELCLSILSTWEGWWRAPCCS